MSEGKKYGLIIPNRTAKSKAVVNPLSVFGNDDDDDDQEVNTSGARFPMKDGKKAQIKRQVQLEMEKAVAVDPTVYEYDNIYDDLQAKKAVSDKQLASDVDRKPKYIGSLLKAAEQRKKDMERRIEKTVQKEREAEKGLFDDTEAFVTDAYRRKMEQIRQEEERERSQAELEARMDVTKQEDMSAFYRNLLDQTTDNVVKTEPSQSEETAVLDERSLQQPAAVAVPGDEDDSDDSSSSDSSTTHSDRKRDTQDSMRNRHTKRKNIRHRTTSDHSSSELDERRHRGEKYDRHRHTNHGRGDAKAAASEEKWSEKCAGKTSRSMDNDSAKHRSDQGRTAESKHHHRKRGELHRQERESNRKKRNHSDSVEALTSRDSKLESPVQHTSLDDGHSKQKQAKTELDQTSVQSKTAKQTVGTALEIARARYLARKGKANTPVVCEDSD